MPNADTLHSPLQPSSAHPDCLKLNRAWFCCIHCLSKQASEHVTQAGDLGPALLLFLSGSHYKALLMSLNVPFLPNSQYTNLLTPQGLTLSPPVLCLVFSVWSPDYQHRDMFEFQPEALNQKFELGLYNLSLTSPPGDTNALLGDQSIVCRPEASAFPVSLLERQKFSLSPNLLSQEWHLRRFQDDPLA